MFVFHYRVLSPRVPPSGFSTSGHARRQPEPRPLGPADENLQDPGSNFKLLVVPQPAHYVSQLVSTAAAETRNVKWSQASWRNPRKYFFFFLGAFSTVDRYWKTCAERLSFEC